MEIHTDGAADGTRCTVSGEADADNCSELGEALLGEQLAGPVRVDLSALSFIDSTAVSELLRIQQALAARDVALSITDTSPAVHRVLEITGLLEIFGLAST